MWAATSFFEQEDGLGGIVLLYRLLCLLCRLPNKASVGFYDGIPICDLQC